MSARSRRTDPTTFRSRKSEHKRFVIWLWTRGAYMAPCWYERMKCDTLELARARIAYMKEHHPGELVDGYVITVETTTITHKVLEEEGEL